MNTEEKSIVTEEELVNNIPTQEEIISERVREKFLIMAENPGLEVEFEPDEADFAGAFVEDALSYEDAIESALLGEIPHS